MSSSFFTGLTALQTIYLDYNPFSVWEIPESLKHATGTIPDFLEANTFPGLKHLHLAFNNIQGPILLGFENTFFAKPMVEWANE
ncbi:hypothetical protein Q3G72_033894 [Acer saccharum]|nr:hypothetical protein Q3G72_033894 [Acer saccharum]